uniref:SFRICE_015447 n=1 Tax=Spodoptera frugiperda TaxID=7108 RepID=A0A2H1VWW6_SPOFR
MTEPKQEFVDQLRIAPHWNRILHVASSSTESGIVPISSTRVLQTNQKIATPGSSIPDGKQCLSQSPDATQPNACNETIARSISIPTPSIEHADNSVQFEKQGLRHLPTKSGTKQASVHA